MPLARAAVAPGEPHLLPGIFVFGIILAAPEVPHLAESGLDRIFGRSFLADGSADNRPTVRKHVRRRDPADRTSGSAPPDLAGKVFRHAEAPDPDLNFRKLLASGPAF